MSAEVPYVRWRGGRPRFDPGSRARLIGFTGRDLRHDDGRWYSLDEATTFSVDIARQMAERRKEAASAGRILARPSSMPKPATNHSGYVYFLRSGERIKIGFSRHPIARARDLSTALSHGVEALAIVRGTEREERAAHWQLRAYKQAGEWFDCHPKVISLMMRCISIGRMMLDQNGHGTDPDQDAARCDTSGENAARP